MPISPLPPNTKDPDLWTDATFFDVTLVNMVQALISSGKFAPGPIVMELALAATADIMVQTGRWSDSAATNYTQDQLTAIFRQWKSLKV